MNGEVKKVLVTVKAYPNPSKKYEETVCVAGVDLDTGKWIRLYPISFRDLDEDKKFPKYNVIKVRAVKSASDKRPESYKVDMASIEIVEKKIETKDGWKRRKEIVLPTASSSFCEILREKDKNDKSLGMFKPRNIDFLWEKSKKPADAEEIKRYYAQMSFLSRAKKPIEQIPFDFRYRFFCCNEPLCKGHDLLIIDWEINQSYRRWRHEYKTEQELLEKIRERWLMRMCSSKNDVYFYVGNMQRFRNNFMVLGVFYPPLVR